MDTCTVNKNVLVVAAHPDDEILGPGATLAAHTQRGDRVWILILGEGQTSRYSSEPEADRGVVEELHSDTMAAAAVLGAERVIFRDLPDNRFDMVALLDIAKAVEAVIEEYRPSVIYTHHGGDLNIDHRRTYQAVLTAARPMEGCPVREIYAYPTLSSTEWNHPAGTGGEGVFVPNVFIPVTGEQLDKKTEAMKCYKSELREFPHPRSIEMIAHEAARWGGVCGYPLAEVFECVRIVGRTNS